MERGEVYERVLVSFACGEPSPIRCMLCVFKTQRRMGDMGRSRLLFVLLLGSCLVGSLLCGPIERPSVFIDAQASHSIVHALSTYMYVWVFVKQKIAPAYIYLGRSSSLRGRRGQLLAAYTL